MILGNWRAGREVDEPPCCSRVTAARIRILGRSVRKSEGEGRRGRRLPVTRRRRAWTSDERRSPSRWWPCSAAAPSPRAREKKRGTDWSPRVRGSCTPSVQLHVRAHAASAKQEAVDLSSTLPAINAGRLNHELMRCFASL